MHLTFDRRTDSSFALPAVRYLYLVNGPKATGILGRAMQNSQMPFGDFYLHNSIYIHSNMYHMHQYPYSQCNDSLLLSLCALTYEI